VGVDEKLGQTVPLDLMLVDEQGERVSLRSLLDKPTLLTLNYFRCSGLCTPLLNGVAELLSRTDQVPGKDFQVLTVSFDPRDNAELAELERRTTTSSSWARISARRLALHDRRPDFHQAPGRRCRLPLRQARR
jgi:cytochrome oxidase Cu insertion factor (SCO1/SenC/PrrC family)